jgi:LCP family protein required for cell wall assembly
MPAGPQNSDAALPPHLDPRGRRHRRTGRQWRHNAARIGMSVGALLSIALLLLAGYAYWTYRDLNNGITRIQVSALGQQPSQPKGQPTYHYDGKDENILLIGNDDRSQETPAEERALHAKKDGGSLNTDTMMILHLPADGRKATLISLPRDTYVHIDGEGMNRLNSAYAWGYNNRPAGESVAARRAAGADLLISTITNLTGLKIDHYMQVSLLGFYEISDALGGVPINLCEDADDSHAANAAAGLSGGSGFKMTKGKHSISGVTALEFVRQRHFLDKWGGDLARVKRQQYFLTSAFREVASAGIITKLNALKSAIQRTIILDPSLNLLDLAHQMENLSANNITGKTIPTSPAMIDGADVLQVDPPAVRKFVSNAVNPPAPAPSSATPSSGTTITAPAHKPIDSKCIH